MDKIEALIQLAVSFATLATLVWGLVKMFQSAQEARETRAEALAAAISAMGAAHIASQHAIVASEGVKSLSGTLDQVVTNTNGMSHRLEQLAGQAGEVRGRAQAEHDREKE